MGLLQEPQLGFDHADFHAKKAPENLVLRKYRHLLEDDWLRRWYLDKSRRSTRTAKSYVKVLGRVMDRIGCTPSEFIALEQDEREGRLIDYLDAQSAAGRSDSALDLEDAVVKSWMAWRRVPITRRTNRRRNPGNSRSASIRIGSRDDLRRLMLTMGVRSRFLLACTAYSAMRPHVLSDQDQSDGLRFRDLPEVRLVDAKVVFDAIPTLVKVRWNLSKNKKPYPTFWSQETCGYFQALTEERIRAGETITPNSLVFPPTQNSPTGFLGEMQLYTLVRAPMDRAGLTDSTPYTWKSYCIDGMMRAERDRPALLKEHRHLIAGHECGLHADYALRKGELTPETKETIRAAYEACAARHLEAFPLVRPQDARFAQYAVLLRAFGYTESQLEEMDLARMDEEKLVTLAQDAMRNMTMASTPAAPVKAHQRVVAASGWEMLLDEGWIYKTSLPDGRVLMEQV